MNYRDVTWVVVGLELLAVEIFTFVHGDSPLTDSMRNGADRWILWPVLFGGFSGHFFGERGGPPWGPYLLIAAVLVAAWRDLFLRSPVPRHTQAEVFLLFFAAAAWLWGSR